MNSKEIQSVTAIQILDSRGNPTVCSQVTLSDGSSGIGIAPSGASTGKYEAYEKRDNDDGKYNGKGVLNAVESVNKVISKAVSNQNITDIFSLDSMLLELDGTEKRKSWVRMQFFLYQWERQGHLRKVTVFLFTDI